MMRWSTVIPFALFAATDPGLIQTLLVAGILAMLARAEERTIALEARVGNLESNTKAKP